MAKSKPAVWADEVSEALLPRPGRGEAVGVVGLRMESICIIKAFWLVCCSVNIVASVAMSLVWAVLVGLDAGCVVTAGITAEGNGVVATETGGL